MLGAGARQGQYVGVTRGYGHGQGGPTHMGMDIVSAWVWTRSVHGPHTWVYTRCRYAALPLSLCAPVGACIQLFQAEACAELWRQDGDLVAAHGQEGKVLQVTQSGEQVQ